MNRFLVGGCLIVLFGCGARTDYFVDQDAPQAGGGVPNGGGAPQVFAGGSSVGGSPSMSGGAPGIGGRPNSIAGAPGVGGAPNAKGGAPGSGGVPNTSAGAPNAKGGAPGSGGSGSSPGIIQACQVIAGDSCQQCLCKTCSSQIVECLSNFGCALILACAQQTGCQGLACYGPQACRSVIDQFGGLTGKSMGNVVSLLSCSIASQNSCSCN
ncbi:MAG TPA: hypothetical protein VJV79_31185 [Polyangiaceae bacterium]|nr:hypothetical protein [Polyangiaceae bacterium]